MIHLTWRVDYVLCPCIELQSIANAAIPFIEQFGTKRAGRPATVRTVQICGGNGRVAYSMLGTCFHDPNCNAIDQQMYTAYISFGMQEMVRITAATLAGITRVISSTMWQTFQRLDWFKNAMTRIAESTNRQCLIFQLNSHGIQSKERSTTV